MRHFFILMSACMLMQYTQAQPMTTGNEPYRPQIHFSPKAHWMNDPNGMVFQNGIYHLFFQYYPDGSTWGPMHWGHATSKNLVNWNEQPIAIYPDSLGYIFSGSAVVDSANTSGLGKNGKGPLVAIFTHHDPVGEKAGSNTYQNQSIAYSNDDGKTWQKYPNNPVLKNPGITDFRDPKVSWYAPEKKWIMTLATKDRITFFSSKNLRDWQKESDFGANVGAHGGVWECPDLFPMTHNNKTVWVLLVSINPGGPNSGSATQYFTGNFDGKTFTPLQTDTRWIDWGTDNYAGVTWNNTGNRRLFLGWMSNWNYANVVPTAPWRSAMTIPRDLSLELIGDKYFIKSQPAPELMAGTKTAVVLNTNANTGDITSRLGQLKPQSSFKLSTSKLQSFTFTLANEKGEKLVAGYDAKTNEYYIDRSNSGNISFEPRFKNKQTAPRLTNAAGSTCTIVIDAASIEIFADGGLTNMTAIFFPTAPYTAVSFKSKGTYKIEYVKLK